MGRDLEICVRKPGGWTVHEIGHAVSPFHSRLYWLSRDRWGSAVALRARNEVDCDSVHHRDDRGDTLDENLVVSWDIAIAVAAIAATVWNVGRFA